MVSNRANARLEGREVGGRRLVEAGLAPRASPVARGTKQCGGVA